jgi:hypothetical protein
VYISDLETTDLHGSLNFRVAEIELHCNHCGGTRFFSHSGTGEFIGNRKKVKSFLTYICRNCRVTSEMFAASSFFSVRVVLIELAERVSQAMKDEVELNEAADRLANKKTD